MSQATYRTVITLAAACGAVICGFSATVSRATSAKTPTGPAAVELQTLEKSLGRIEARQLTVVEFPVRNRGAERLVINEADSRCGCADPDGRTYIIPPGGEGCLSVSIERDAIGLIRKTNSYTTNDPACPRFELSVTAFVR